MWLFDTLCEFLPSGLIADFSSPGGGGFTQCTEAMLDIGAPIF